jgi:hypothetical protein
MLHPLSPIGRPLLCCFALVLACLPGTASASPAEADFLTHLDRLAARWEHGGLPPEGEPRQRAWADLLALREHARSAGFSPLATARVGELDRRFAPPAAATEEGDGPDAFLRGTVRARTGGQPIVNVTIVVYDRNGFYSTQTRSDADGSFQARVSAGRYFLLFHGNEWAAQRYRLLPCVPGDCDARQGTPVEVAAGETADGLDFELVPGGRIAGKAVHASDGAPIAYGRVEFFDSEGRPVDSAEVIDGRYASRSLASGVHFARMENTDTEVGQLFGGGPHCFNEFAAELCEPEDGAPILVEPDREARADFSLIAGGSISGAVFDPGGQLFQETHSITVVTDAGRGIWSDGYLHGPFEAGPLPPGSYAVYAIPYDYPPQLYHDHVCILPCSFGQGDPIVVGIGQRIEHADFHLHRFGALAGRVEDRVSGTGLVDAEVRLYEAASRQEVRHIRTKPDGTFFWPQLPPGSYLAVAGDRAHEWRTSGDVGFLEQDIEATLPQATAFSVPEGGRLDLPPFRLRPLGKLRGRVVDAATGAPVDGGVLVYAFLRVGEPAGGAARVADDGFFEIDGLDPGIYHLGVDGPRGRDLLVGSARLCLFDALTSTPPIAACELAGSTSFEVGLGQPTPDAGEIRLPAAAILRGALRLAPGRLGKPTLLVYGPDGRYLDQWHRSIAANSWDFEISLPGGGTYFLLALVPEHVPQAYAGLDCGSAALPDCSQPQLATPVATTAGEIVAGLDFQLRLDHRLCQPSAERICLGGGRFSVSSRHRDLQGLHASQAYRITDEAGYFTFFDPGNVEVVVKVLNACEVYGSFWLFAAGLTDVENYLLVRDNWAAITWVYGTPGPFRPFVDTVSFATCGAEPPEGGAASPAPEALTPAEPAPNGCGTDPALALCLGGRFAVSAAWTTAGGLQGSGVPQPLTADTGFFYFFSPGNIEVVVKVLDACRADLNQRYWVFAAGMTDVAVTLTVKDTATGDEKLYLSPLGGLFQPIFDFEGFAGCSA